MNASKRFIHGLLFALMPTLMFGRLITTSPILVPEPVSTIKEAAPPQKQAAQIVSDYPTKLQNRGLFRASLFEPANGQPEAENDAYELPPEDEFKIKPIGVLENDYDPEGESLVAELVAPPENGEFILDPDGGFTYTPQEGFFGLDQFVYRAVDSLENADTATVVLNVKDIIPPEVSWILPAETDPEDPDQVPTYYLESWIKTIQLRVLASDNDQVSRVHFYRWDVDSEKHIPIATVQKNGNDPQVFEYTVQVTDLKPQFNQIFAQAVDPAKYTDVRIINIYRPEVLTEPVFIPLLVR